MTATILSSWLQWATVSPACCNRFAPQTKTFCTMFQIILAGRSRRSMKLPTRTKQASRSCCEGHSSPELSNSTSVQPRFCRLPQTVSQLPASRVAPDLHRLRRCAYQSGLREWREFSGDRKLELVGPGTKTCPPFLGHVASQVVLQDEFARNYLERYALTPLSVGERLFKAGLRGARNRQRKTRGFA